MELPIAQLAGLLLVLLRTGGLFLSAPLYSSRVLSGRLRLGLMVPVSLAVWFGAGSPSVEVGGKLTTLMGMALAETVLGLLGGLAARWLLDAAASAGQLAGLSMGLGFGALLDPLNGADSTAISQLVSLLSLALAVSLGLHREAIAWLAWTTHAMPVGTPFELTPFVQRALLEMVMAIAVAVRMAFPMIAAGTFGHLALALIGRAAPQLSLSSIGFSVSIVSGGAALFWLAPEAARMCAQLAVESFTRGRG
jgi:flagellar biosynthetic protein FliR